MRRLTPILTSLSGLAVMCWGCGGESPRKEDGGESTSCADGFLLDAGICVPKECGVGTWGDLEVDESTVFVDASAPDGGDGSEAAPFRSIQDGADAAGRNDGGLVAIAAGTYPETLVMDGHHLRVRLSGRCRELVVLDASVGDAGTPGIDMYFMLGELSGLTVRGSNHLGVSIAYSSVRFVDVGVEESSSFGLQVTQYEPLEFTNLRVESSVFESNKAAAIAVFGTNSEVTLVDSEARATRLDEHGDWGVGIYVTDGGMVAARDCALESNAGAAVLVSEWGSEVTLEHTVLRDTRPSWTDGEGPGIFAHSGAALRAQGCELLRNRAVEVVATGEGTTVELVDTRILDTVPGSRGGGSAAIIVGRGARLSACSLVVEGAEWAGVDAYGDGTTVSLVDTTIRDILLDSDGWAIGGALVSEGASLLAEGCLLESNAAVGLLGYDPGTSVVLVDSVIRDTRTESDGEGGYGVILDSGVTFEADGCAIAGNTTVGLLASSFGTVVKLEDTLILGTRPNGLGRGGYGLQVDGGALLVAQDCVLAGNREVGCSVGDPGTLITFERSTVRNTQVGVDGAGGYGLQVAGGATFSGSESLFDGNTAVGVLVMDPDSSISLVDSTVTATGSSTGRQGTVGVGAISQAGGVLTASGVRLSSNEGPGLLASGAGARSSCEGCSLGGNRFAGAVVIDSASLELASCTISETVESADLGGGTGIYGGTQWGWGSPILVLEDCSITDNAVAAVYLGGRGSYQLTGNTFLGGMGIPHGSTTRCGDGVFAADTAAWDGSSGLVLEGNTFVGNTGAGLFLDDAWATLGGNTWSDNQPDLFVQGEACLDPLGGYSEAPDQELCPAWDRPTCELMFSLSLDVADLNPGMPPLPPLPGVPRIIPARR